MQDIVKRLYRIFRSNTPSPSEFFERWIKQRKHKHYNDFNWDQYENDNKENTNFSGQDEKFDVPDQVVQDLGLFDIEPPSCLEEVRKARNREIKKYHSDKFINDPEKLETSKQIMQIYNAAYERLKTYYENLG